MAPFRCMALFAVVVSGQANAFAPTGLPTRVQSNTACHDILGGFDLAASLSETEIIGAGVAVVAVAAAVAVGGTVLKGSNQPEPVVVDEPEPEPVDVSIPYDAASRLKFEAWLAEGDRGDYDEATFQKFKGIYEKLASAEATVSRYTRELAALEK